MISMRTVAALLMLLGTEAALITTKRTHSSILGYTDEAWFNQYFGVHDNSSLYGPTMWINRAVVLPMAFGIHFPNGTDSAHVSHNETLETMQRANIKRLGNLTKYSAMLDWATVFYVPDLTKHVQQFSKDGVSMLQRRYVTRGGEAMYSVSVYTPGTGHAMELQSNVCDGCDGWLAFGAGECELGHHLPRTGSYYGAAWQNASTAEGMWSEVGDAKLPAPMVVQIRQAVTELGPIKNFWDTVITTESSGNAQCRMVSAVTGVGPFADDYRGQGWPDFPLQIAFVRNDAQQKNLKPFVDFLDRLNSERVGFGWGWDRTLDYHIKLTDSASMNVETKPNVSLDHWAAQLAAHDVRFGAFNLSQGCSETKTNAAFPPRFDGASMVYTNGPGHLGIEFWGYFDYSYFSADQPLFMWGGAHGSATSDCRTYESPPDCAVTSSSGQTSTIRARAAANPPTNNVYATLECPHEQFIEAVSFASFGTPSGDCDHSSFHAATSCDVDIGALVKTLCVGRNSCRVPASTSLFGTPCNSSNGWWMAVDARCSHMSHGAVPLMLVV